MFSVLAALIVLVAVAVAGTGAPTDETRPAQSEAPVSQASDVSFPSAAPVCTATLSPGADLASAFARLRGGDRLCLREGDYAAIQHISEQTDGTRDRPVVVRSYPGEAARIVGIFRLVDGDYWTLSDLEFVRGEGTGDMVRIVGGTGVVLDRLRIHGSKGGAGLLIGRSSAHGPVDDYTLRRSTIYDAPGQSNLYLNPGQDSTGGLVERNIFYNAGTENAKIGWGSSDCRAMTEDRYGSGGTVVFRYNTLYNDPSFGPSSGHQPFTLAEGLTGTVEAHHNLIFNSLRRQGPFLVRLDVEPCEQFTGTATVRDTLVFDPDADAAVCFAGGGDGRPRCDDVIAEGIVTVDPRMNSTDPSTGFRPQEPEARGFGRYAP